MVLLPVHCPKCQGTHVIKNGKSAEGKQRFLCHSGKDECSTFILDYTYKGRLPAIKQQMVEMSLNGSGIRDICRVLRVSSRTVREQIKRQAPHLKQVNVSLLNQIAPEPVEVEILRLKPDAELTKTEAELDECWSFVGSKKNPRWLWHAIDHRSWKVLAYVFGARKDEVFLQLKALLEPFGITRFYTDGWGAYQRHLETEKHEVGKQNTQQIERKHLTLRTRIKRLARETICFSRSVVMHDIVIGLFINRYEFGMSI